MIEGAAFAPHPLRERYVKSCIFASVQAFKRSGGRIPANIRRMRPPTGQYINKALMMGQYILRAMSVIQSHSGHMPMKRMTLRASDDVLVAT